MKKIFTLAAVALCAMNLDAQEIWKAADFNLEGATIETLTNNIFAGGTAEAPDTSKPGELKSSQIVAKTANITLTGVSTPNADKSESIVTGADAWQLKGSIDGNDALIVNGCNPQFAQYLMGQGNPEAISWYYYELNSDGDEVFRIAGSTWQPGDDMPAKGAYWKFDAAAAGTLKIAIYGNKNGNPTYIVDASTKQPLAPADVDVAIFYQNTGFAFEGNVDEGTAKYLNVGKMAEDYVLQHTNGITQNRPVLGYLTFSVEAGKSYYLLNTKSQIGLYGFEFNAGQSGIADIIADKTLDENAPIYNVYGQRVNKDYKGVLIQNGKKFINR